MGRPRQNDSRVFTRNRNGIARYYGDFRDFKAVGGKLEPLRAAGDNFATKDLKTAKNLAAERLKVLRRLRQDAADLFEPGVDVTRLDVCIERHLMSLTELEAVTLQWLASIELHLDTAHDYFGGRTRLDEFSPRMIKNYIPHLASLPNGRVDKNGVECTLSKSTQRKYLNSLSGLFEAAIEDGLLPIGQNPVRGVSKKSKPRNVKARELATWLEVPDAALLLHAARILVHKRPPTR